MQLLFFLGSRGPQGAPWEDAERDLKPKGDVPTQTVLNR